jgi:hypothetical protein
VPDATRLLARHFFRRFIENDLISPDADRHQTLAVVSACIISFALVVTMLLAIKYLTALPTPGQVSLGSLDDKFLYVGWSMAVMALMTLAEWDALALDARDASILGPLPIPASTIFRAKAAALAVFAGGCVTVLNIIPTIIYSSAVVSKLVVGPSAYVTLIAVHWLTTTAAGAFGFLSVLGAREVLHAFLGTRLFNRISTVLQAGLVISVVVFLCLLPGLSNRVGRMWLAPERLTYLMPPLWFVGLYEVGAGHVIDDLSRTTIPKRLLRFDRESTEVYRSRQAEFRTLAQAALSALVLAGVVAVMAYTWNNRRLPPALTGQRDLPHRMRKRFIVLVERSVARRPLMRAGFFFALQTLWRSGTHRLTMAIAIAVGLALATVFARGSEIRDVLLIQPMVLMVLLTAFRHAARVPGELRANWTFQLCWSGDAAPYMAGVKLAALLCVATPALVAMLPLDAALLGWRAALQHTMLGGLIGHVAIEIEMLGFRTLPFASSYSGGGNLKGWLPVMVIVFFPLAHILAGIEGAALTSWHASAILAAVLLAVLPGIRVLERRQRDSYGPVDFYDLPGQTQQLDLST